MTEELYDPDETESALTGLDALLRELQHGSPIVRALPGLSWS
jgi:hypothetical protein